MCGLGFYVVFLLVIDLDVYGVLLGVMVFYEYVIDFYRGLFGFL